MPSTPVVVLDSTLTNIANAIRSKTGGSATMTPGQMPAQIASIPSGGSSIGIPREVSDQGEYQKPAQSFVFSLPTSATNLGGRALEYALGYSSSLTAVDMSSLTTVTGAYAAYNAFYNCANLGTVDLGSLMTVSGRSSFFCAFLNCSGLTSVNLSSLATVSGREAFYQAFSGCTSLTSLTLTSLANVTGSSSLGLAFLDCTSLTSLSFPALTASSFGSYTNQFNDMLQGVTGCTVHFPAAIQSTIGSWSSVTSGFGGTNTTVLFDL